MSRSNPAQLALIEPPKRDPKPRNSIITRTSAEFFAVCDREKANEFRVVRLFCLKQNGHYEFEIASPFPQ